MKNITFFILLLVGLCSITPCYSFDFKNIIFGGNDDQTNKDTLTETKRFGYNVPPQFVKERQTSDQGCTNGYLCQDTKKCVTEPKDCPCRLEADIKCQLGKDWYTCIRGDQNCEQMVGAL